MKFLFFLGYCGLVGSLTYSVILQWIWSPNGWLVTRGYHDLAGTGSIHLCGGTAALVASWIVGPRY